MTILFQDFFINIDWARERPVMTEILDEAKKKANKQLAHLSGERINLIKNDENGWRVVEIERDINLVIEKFEKCFKKEDK